MVRPTQKQWNDFVKNYLVFDDDTNVKGDFSSLSKKAAVPYFEFLKAQWICSRDHMGAQEFCKMNGDVPVGFFEKNIRNNDHEFEIEIY